MSEPAAIPALNDKGKGAALMVTIILVVAIAVLAVDWQIKNAILEESRKLRGLIESYERKYYSGKEAEYSGSGNHGSAFNYSSVRGDDLAGNASMEAGDSSTGSVSPIRPVEAEGDRSVDPGAGDGHMAFPEGD